MKKHKLAHIVFILLFAVCILSLMPHKESKVHESTAVTSNDVVASTEQRVEVKKEFYEKGENYQNGVLSVTMSDCGIAKKASISPYVKVPAGNKVVYAKFDIKNIGKSDCNINYTNFSGYADNDSCDQYYSLNNMGKVGMDFSENLSSGRTISGTVAFIVPDNAKDFEIEYQPSILFADKVIFKVEIK